MPGAEKDYQKQQFEDNNSLKTTTGEMANILSDKEQAEDRSGIRSIVWPSDIEEDEDGEDGEDEEDTD